VVVIAVLIWLWRQPRLPIWQGLAVGLLLGGSLGNGIDRWRLGYVVDFLALVPINFPIFNPADVAINLAVICFAVDLWSNRSGNRRG
jgi:signal peptidase II